MSEEKNYETKIKLVIWDADNTLWDGTVYYRDKEAIKIKPGTKAALKELDKRGIISTMCSKNNYEDVDEMLKKFEINEYFKEPQVGWGLKSEAIKKLADIFKVSFEQILFIDDDPFQRAEVTATISGLNVTELADPIDILNIDGIKPKNETDEDKERVKILKEARDREEAEKSHGGNYKDFLRQCGIKMFVRNVEEKDWPRVTQLLNRTNELNATGNRYQLDELKKSFEVNKDKVFIVELTDKFGDYGLIAETIIDTTEPGVWSIRDLTVSCRTMGRGIGSTLILVTLHLAKKEGIRKVKGYVKTTESNWRMQPLFEKRGFTQISDEGEVKRYEFDLNNEIMKYPDWLDITINI
ncbi:MAG: HAD-IIIC family phosphatase [Patescibacteria group bacterium]|nr:HAD-IIIC family phosphatase [Patescibacteria group bacterium]MDD5491027.1 HAD-IIIC family phosphatase [Patescibacteria group bacterium]